MTRPRADDRVAYGIDAGTRNTVLMKVSHLEAVRLPMDAASEPKAIAEALARLGAYPLGIDAPLSFARGADGRAWEAWARAFRTPPPSGRGGGSRQLEAWKRMSRVWTKVAFLLCEAHGWTVWDGRPAQSGKLLVEVYPRLSWTMFLALGRCPVPLRPSKSERMQNALASFGLRLPGRLSNHGRDAIVCAMTARAVAEGDAAFLGEPAERRDDFHVGGGVAIPLALRVSA